MTQQDVFREIKALTALVETYEAKPTKVLSKKLRIALVQFKKAIPSFNKALIDHDKQS
jgi:hypothetical protein